MSIRLTFPSEERFSVTVDDKDLDRARSEIKKDNIIEITCKRFKQVREYLLLHINDTRFIFSASYEDMMRELRYLISILYLCKYDGVIIN